MLFGASSLGKNRQDWSSDGRCGCDQSCGGTAGANHHMFVGEQIAYLIMVDQSVLLGADCLETGCKFHPLSGRIAKLTPVFFSNGQANYQPKNRSTNWVRCSILVLCVSWFCNWSTCVSLF